MKKKIIFSPGSRYHLNQYLDVLNLEKLEYEIFSSSPKKNFKNHSNYVKFAPLFNSIVNYIFKSNFHFLSEKQAFIYTKYIDLFHKIDCDFFHAWAFYGFELFEKIKNNTNLILERSCPHIITQETILKDESNFYINKYKKKSDWWIDRSLKEYSICNKIVVPSEHVKKSFLENNVDSGKIKIIPLLPNFDPNLFPSEKIKENNEIVFGAIMNNCIRKGLFHLIKCYQKINFKNKKLILRISKSELSNYKHLNNIIIHDQSIVIKERYEKIESFYKSIDIFMMPSIDDGYGMAALECLPFVKGAIISNRIGAYDTLKSENIDNLFFINPYDHVDFINKTDMAISNISNNILLNADMGFIYNKIKTNMSDNLQSLYL